MKRSSMLSRAFFRRPTVRELVPDLKLVLAVLTIGCESHVGVYRPAGLGEDTGLDSLSLAGALDDLERRGHVARDAATGELFISAFYRDNTFSTAARRGQARDDFGQIESQRLRDKVLRAITQNPTCGLGPIDISQNQQVKTQGQGEGEGKGVAAAPRASARGFAGAAAPFRVHKQGKVRTVRASGIVTWCPDDPPAAEQIERQHTAEEINEAVSAITVKGQDAVPGLVARAISQKRSAQQSAQRRAVAEAAYQARLSAPPTSPDVAASQAAKELGDAILAQLRQKQSVAR